MTRNCITLTNHTDKPVEINIVQDKSVADGDRGKAIAVAPNDTMVFFLGAVESLSWTKK